MKKLSEDFFNEKANINQYSNLYKKLNLNNNYPANVKRLEIFKNLLKKYKPKKIIDAGCGAGMPLVKLRKMGFNVFGYDKAAKMIKEAKINLKKYNLSSDYVEIGDFENPTHIKNNSVECILGMGAFYYSKKFNRTLKRQIKKLKKNGRLIFSLRNELFNISTFNDYSINFFSDLYNIDKYDKKTKKIFMKMMTGYKRRQNTKIKNIDDYNVYSSTHNPITIEKEILNKLGLKCNGIYFYHFHILPPIFEKYNKSVYRNLSYKIEKPEDWRGYFMASAFVVDCQKL